MNFKQMVGLCLLSIGVVSLAFAFHRSESYNTPTERTSSPVSPTAEWPGSPDLESVPTHPRPFFILGIFCVALGITLSFYYHKK